MDLKAIVAGYTDNTAGKVEVDLKSLILNTEAKQLFAQAVHKKIKSKRNTCFFIPKDKNDNYLGLFVNELALNLRHGVLVTGDIKRLHGTFIRCASVKDVVIIQPKFGNKENLAAQIAAIKTTGRKVSVCSLIAHSKEEVEAFASDYKIDAFALVYLEEL